MSADGKQIVFSAFDLMNGKGLELRRFTDEHADEMGWDISPDGTQVVASRDFDSRFHIIRLSGAESDRTVRMRNGTHLRNILWSSDGQGFFAAAATQHGAEFVYIDLQGKTRHLWELAGNNVFLAGHHSPDGRHLAIQASAGSSNTWMIDNF